MMDAWSRVPKPDRPGCALRVTPPLPLHWGESRPLEWVLNGYGADILPPGVADAERIAPPFTRAEARRPGAWKTSRPKAPKPTSRRIATPIHTTASPRTLSSAGWNRRDSKTSPSRSRVNGFRVVVRKPSVPVAAHVNSVPAASLLTLPAVSTSNR
jgi:hypothetical protein